MINSVLENSYFFHFFKVLLKYSGFTVLYTEQFGYTCTHIHSFFRFFSHIDHHRLLGRVPCAILQASVGKRSLSGNRRFWYGVGGRQNTPSPLPFPDEPTMERVISEKKAFGSKPTFVVGGREKPRRRQWSHHL